MVESLTAIVRRCARGACEYCRLPDDRHPGSFEIEHIVPRQHGGRTVLSNLAYSCLRCNRAKGPNLAGIDRGRSPPRMAPLYHPRRHRWAVHFRWEGSRIAGRTPIGRATVAVLQMNDPLRVQVREGLIALGGFPPRW